MSGDNLKPHQLTAAAILLKASILIVKQRRLIAAQKAYIALLRQKLLERDVVRVRGWRGMARP